MVSQLNKLKSRFRQASIANKILAIVTLCSLLALSLISAASILRDYQLLSERKLDQLSSLAGILSTNAVGSLRFDDPNTAQEYLDSLSSENGITCAIVFDRNQEIFAAYHKDANRSELAYPDFYGPKQNADSFSYSKRIELGNHYLGTILLRSDTHEFWSNMLTSLAINIAVLAAALAIAVFLAKRLLPVITGPVEDLVAVARKVSEDRDYTLRAKKRYDDEIGELVDSINFMLRTVRARDQEINATNRNLEKLVADRTEKLVEAREKAEKALEAKSDFLARMSHELRTPMNAIIGMSSVIQSDAKDPEHTRQIEIIRKSANSLLLLVNDILDYSKIEANRLVLENKPFDLVAAIEESMDIAAATNRNLFVVASSAIDPKLPTRLVGDATRFRQILINLLSNAFKFTQEGYVSLEAHFLSAQNDSPVRIQISVQDTGIGIPPSGLKTIFDSFTQVDTSISRKFGGTGLGLSISHHLATAMGGQLEVESVEEEGSTFTLTVPINTNAPSPPAIGRSLNFEHPPLVSLRDLPRPIHFAISQYLECWGCRIATHITAAPENTDKADITIASAIASNEREAVSLAESYSKDDHTLLLCHPDHAVSVKRASNSLVLTTPLRIRDLKSPLINLLGLPENQDAPERDPIANYPIDQWKGLRILLAEDNELNQNVFVHHMKLMGIEVDTVTTGRAALRLASQNPYDIIFMDIRMPVMDGLQATASIRQNTRIERQPWVVGFTANHDPAALMEIENAGMNDYLAKPAKVTDIANAIHRYLFQKHELLRDDTQDN